MKIYDYECKTTFWDDFTVADRFGKSAIVDTFGRAFGEWKDNYVYLTELVMVLNHKIWQWYEKNEFIAGIYNALYEQANEYAWNNLQGEELTYFYTTTD